MRRGQSPSVVACWGGHHAKQFSGGWQEMAIALVISVALAGHPMVQWPPYFAAVWPPFSFSLSLPLLGVDLGGVFNISLSFLRCSLVSASASSAFYLAPNTLTNYTSHLLWSWPQSFLRASLP